MINWRVLICGGRELDSTKVARWCVNHLRSKLWLHSPEPFRVSAIISGHQKGADMGGEIYAAAWLQMIPLTYPIDPTIYDQRDGPSRNLKMILDGKPDIVFAFPGHSGTADMIAQAESYSIPVIHIEGTFT